MGHDDSDAVNFLHIEVESLRAWLSVGLQNYDVLRFAYAFDRSNGYFH